MMTSVGKGVKKREHLHSVSGNVNWHSHYRKRMKIPPKIKIELSFDLALLFLSIHPKKMKSMKYLPSHVHYEIIHNSQDVETASMSVQYE